MQQLVGYCPQVCAAMHALAPNSGTRCLHQVYLCLQIDPLLELLSAKEQLRLYASLKATAPEAVEAEVESLLVCCTASAAPPACPRAAPASAQWPQP